MNTKKRSSKMTQKARSLLLEQAEGRLGSALSSLMDELISFAQSNRNLTKLGSRMRISSASQKTYASSRKKNFVVTIEISDPATRS